MKPNGLAVVILTVGTVGSAFAREWKTRESLDPMTDRKVFSATLESEKATMLLTLVCSMGKKKPDGGIVLQVGNVIDWTFVQGSRRARIDFRFDQEKAISRLGSVLEGGGTWSMINSSMTKNEPRDFVKALASHSRLMVQPPMYQGSALDAFDLSGFPSGLFPKGCF